MVSVMTEDSLLQQRWPVLGCDQGIWGLDKVGCLEGAALGRDMKCMSRQWACAATCAEKSFS